MLVSLITGFFAAMATGIYASLVSRVTTNHAAGQRAQIISLLQEVSKNLSQTVTRSVNVKFNEQDSVDFSKLYISYDSPEYQGRVFGIGKKEYRSSFYIKGLEQAKMSKEDIIRVEWDYLGQRITTFKETPLFLTNMNLGFEIKARVWVDEKLENKIKLKNPILLEVQFLL